MSTAVSVVICAHDPRADYLARVLDGLRKQTLSRGEWELLLIDNASAQPLASKCDLSWHPKSRCILESDLGLTAARLRGIHESRGALVIFVDDDNVLAADYLDCAIQIAKDYPFVGAFGGSAIGEFEVTPEPWIQRYLIWLAVRKVERDCWSNSLVRNDSTPVGAGLCIRRPVAQDYQAKVLASHKRRALDRVGTGTGSHGDTDLAYCAIDVGMGIGTFRRLQLIHLIPKQRLTVDYIARLGIGIFGSEEILKDLRPATDRTIADDRMAAFRFWAKLALSSKIDRRIQLAVRSGRLKGKKFLRDSAADPALLQA